MLDSNLSFVGIDVRKGDASTEYEVDGISGGTITSDGVEAMILDCVKAYVPFLKMHSGVTATASLTLEIVFNNIFKTTKLSDLNSQNFN